MLALASILSESVNAAELARYYRCISKFEYRWKVHFLLQLLKRSKSETLNFEYITQSNVFQAFILILISIMAYSLWKLNLHCLKTIIL